MTTFVLVHSPLVGPLSWGPVAAELERRGRQVIVPGLSDAPSSGRPFYEQHAASAAVALGSLPPGESLVLVGHSGAGLLLPAIRSLVEKKVEAYLFVDAGIPVNGKSRLDLLKQELPEASEHAHRQLLNGAELPLWSDADLQEEIPDPQLRRVLLAQLRPRPLAYWDESIPVFAGWPDAPCGYLLFSPGYAYSLARAKEMGWVYTEMPGGHFHMTVAPGSTVDAMLGLLAQIGLSF